MYTYHFLLVLVCSFIITHRGKKHSSIEGGETTSPLVYINHNFSGLEKKEFSIEVIDNTTITSSLNGENKIEKIISDMKKIKLFAIIELITCVLLTCIIIYLLWERRTFVREREDNIESLIKNIYT